MKILSPSFVKYNSSLQNLPIKQIFKFLKKTENCLGLKFEKSFRKQFDKIYQSNRFLNF